MTPKKTLENLGLSSPEAELYIILSQSGGMTATALAKHSGFRRTTVYPILKKLAAKGFVLLYIKRGQQFFIAEKPQNVAGFFEKKIKLFTETMPLLGSSTKKEWSDDGLRFIESPAELEKFYSNILTEYRGKSYCVISNNHAWHGPGLEFFQNFRDERVRAGIQTRVLLSGEAPHIRLNDPRRLREVRLLPAKYQYNSSIDIFDNKVLVVSHEQSSLAVVIAVPAMVDIFKSTFQMLWEFVQR